MPIRANGTLNFKVKDYVKLIDNVAGVKDSYLVNDVSIRLTSVLTNYYEMDRKRRKDMFIFKLILSKLKGNKR